MKETLIANKWYPFYQGPGRSYKSIYPTPQSILRSCVGSSEYKFTSNTVTTEHIRCACVLPLGLPFQHLLSVPWAMSYKTDEWRMIIASTLDSVSWIELARASGCIAYLKSHSMAVTYQWEQPLKENYGTT